MRFLTSCKKKSRQITGGRVQVGVREEAEQERRETIGRLEGEEDLNTKRRR